MDGASTLAAPQGQLVYAVRGQWHELDVQGDAEKGFDIAASLPQRIMGTCFDSPVPWGKEGDDCVICLGEMVAGEEVSDLPGCNHTFHLQCVAKWLITKVEAGRPGCCPACNSLIISPDYSKQLQPAADTQAAPYSTYCCSDRCTLSAAVMLFLLAIFFLFSASALFSIFVR